MISSHRDRRPWQGETVNEESAPGATHAPDCYLCPGNARISGQRNPDYTGVFASDNDHACVGPEAPPEKAAALRAVSPLHYRASGPHA